ncbi:MAG: GerMN domain-containing protein [Acidobacteria bacterium]|nr:GerMN domain-containing protein [Acidobacteriota bacterium]
MNQRVIIIFLILTLALLVTGILLLYSCEKRKQAEIREEEKAETIQTEELITADEEAATSEVSVKLYFRNPGPAAGTVGLLRPEARQITTSPDKRVFVIKILEALLGGPRSGNFASIPPGVAVRQVFLVDNLAVIDFSREIHTRHPGGVLEELATIYSIVNTIVDNVPGVERVRILVEGEERSTLAGHLHLSRNLYHSPRYLVGWRGPGRIIQEENLQ